MQRLQDKRIGYHLTVILLVTILSFADYVILRIIDITMAEYVQGFKARLSYSSPTIIFFIVVFTAIHIGIKYGWNRILPHIYIGVAVFFPLIFLTSYWEITNPLSSEIREAYVSIHCHSQTSTYKTICGKALSNLVLSRTVSTIPLLFIIPLLFYKLSKIPFFKTVIQSHKKHHA